MIKSEIISGYYKNKNAMTSKVYNLPVATIFN